MDKPLHIIHKKIGNIELGLLRYIEDDKKVTLHVNIIADSNDILHCIIDDELPTANLYNRDITIVQKDKENYIYVDGRIFKIFQGKKSKPVVYIKVNKACWFTRKRQGSVTSLQEKCVYEMAS